MAAGVEARPEVRVSQAQGTHLAQVEGPGRPVPSGGVAREGGFRGDVRSVPPGVLASQASPGRYREGCVSKGAPRPDPKSSPAQASGSFRVGVMPREARRADGLAQDPGRCTGPTWCRPVGAWLPGNPMRRMWAPSLLDRLCAPIRGPWPSGEPLPQGFPGNPLVTRGRMKEGRWAVGSFEFIPARCVHRDNVLRPCKQSWEQKRRRYQRHAFTGRRRSHVVPTWFLR
jgi:hypothetical protein